jgi:hypothetical protein
MLISFKRALEIASTPAPIGSMALCSIEIPTEHCA